MLNPAEQVQEDRDHSFIVEMQQVLGFEANIWPSPFGARGDKQEGTFAGLVEKASAHQRDEFHAWSLTFAQTLLHPGAPISWRRPTPAFRPSGPLQVSRTPGYPA